MNLFQDKLSPVIYGNNQRAVIDYYLMKGLLAPMKECPECFERMKIVPRPQLTDKYAWHCHAYLCGTRSYHSMRDKSFFTKGRVPLNKYLHLIYLCAQEASVKMAQDTLGISRQAVQQHYQFLREVCSTNLLNNQDQLGGPGICQIDESLFRHKTKDHRGLHPISDQWVFGICDTSTTPGKCHMELVPDRSAAILIPIIEMFIRRLKIYPLLIQSLNITCVWSMLRGIPTYFVRLFVLPHQEPRALCIWS